MSDSALDGKKILSVDDEPDVLDLLEEEIMGVCPNCRFERAANYEDARKLIESQSYDVVILDIMGVRGFDLLEIAVKRGFRAAILTAHSLSPEALERSIAMKARAYISKEKLGQIVPLLEDLLKYDYESGLYHSFHASSSDSVGSNESEDETEVFKRRTKTASWYKDKGS